MVPRHLTQGEPDLTLFKRKVGRERRGRNLRPLPRPMDGSNSAIERYLSQALVLSASSSKVCSQKNPWRVRLRQGYASRRSSRLANAIRYLRSGHGVIAAGVHADTLKELPFPRGGSRWPRESSRHRTKADTPARFALGPRVQGVP